MNFKPNKNDVGHAPEGHYNVVQSLGPNVSNTFFVWRSDRLSNRRSLLYLSLLLVSAVVCAAMISEWLSASRQLRVATNELATCQGLTREIASLRNRPRVASLEIESPQQTIGRIVEAQRQGQLASESLVSISPSAPTRLGNTEYQIRTTELVLQHVALNQLHDFASDLGIKQDGLVVRELALTPDRGGSSDASTPIEFWNARLILTQLIYSPTSKQLP